MKENTFSVEIYMFIGIIDNEYIIRLCYHGKNIIILACFSMCAVLRGAILVATGSFPIQNCEETIRHGLEQGKYCN